MPTSIRQSVVFAAKPAAGGKTRLTFTQHGVPNNQFRGISSGWRMYYWNPMKTALER